MELWKITQILFITRLLDWKIWTNGWLQTMKWITFLLHHLHFWPPLRKTCQEEKNQQIVVNSSKIQSAYPPTVHSLPLIQSPEYFRPSSDIVSKFSQKPSLNRHIAKCHLAVAKLAVCCHQAVTTLLLFPLKAVIKLLWARATSTSPPLTKREDTEVSQTGQYVEIPHRDPSPLHAAPQWPPVKSSCLPDLVDTKVKSNKWAKKRFSIYF